MKTAVVYRSVSGFTKKYAQWISEDLGGDLFELSQFSGKVSSNYDSIVFGGPLHAAGIAGLKSFKKKINPGSGKKVIIFACGASPADEKVLGEIRTKNFSVTEKNRISFYYLRGGFDFSRLNPANKIIMSLFRKSLEKKNEKTEEEQGMLDSYENPVDFTEKENIRPIIDELRE